jgi:hypothetical protein
MMRSTILLGFATLLTNCFLCLQPVNAQATYTLKPTPKTVAWGYYDAKAAPVLRIEPELDRLRPAKRAIL